MKIIIIAENLKSIRFKDTASDFNCVSEVPIAKNGKIVEYTIEETPLDSQKKQ